MAEAILNALGAGQWQAFSAGAKPAGFVHPLAIRALKESGYSTEGLRSKSWDEFRIQSFDAVVTVCDHAKESCPIFPGEAKRLHWSLVDPAGANGTEGEKRAVFFKVFGDIQRRVREFISKEEKQP